jgi:hypothetical protein
MSFLDYTKTYLEYIKNIGSYLAGNSSAPTLDIKINVSKDLNTLKNSLSAETLIYTSNAVYDQNAMARSLIEIYKKPKDYFKEYQDFLIKEQSKTEFLNNEFQVQLNNIQDNIQQSKNIINLSPTLQKKLSLITGNE